MLKNSYKAEHLLDHEIASLIGRQISLAKKAFDEVEGKRRDCEKSLYESIGIIYELAHSMREKIDNILTYAKDNGIPANRRSSIYSICAKLIFVRDRQKVSKYASVMMLAEREAVPAERNLFAAYVLRHGGIEACVKRFRSMTHTASPTQSQEAKDALLTQFSQNLGIKADKRSLDESFINHLDDAYQTDVLAVVLVKKGDKKYYFSSLVIDNQSILAQCARDYALNPRK